MLEVGQWRTDHQARVTATGGLDNSSTDCDLFSEIFSYARSSTVAGKPRDAPRYLDTIKLQIDVRMFQKKYSNITPTAYRSRQLVARGRCHTIYDVINTISDP